MPSSATKSLSVGGHAADGVVDYSDRPLRGRVIGIVRQLLDGPTAWASAYGSRSSCADICRPQRFSRLKLSSGLLASSGYPEFMVTSKLSYWRREKAVMSVHLSHTCGQSEQLAPLMPPHAAS